MAERLTGGVSGVDPREYRRRVRGDTTPRPRSRPISDILAELDAATANSAAETTAEVARVAEVTDKLTGPSDVESATHGLPPEELSIDAARAAVRAAMDRPEGQI